VKVDPALRQLLSRLRTASGGALALVSGRPIAELDRLFAPIKLRASGVHGAEIRYSPLEPTRSLMKERLPDNLWSDLVELLRQFPGTLAENKGASFAVHYRFAEAIEMELEAALLSLTTRFAQLGLEVVPGKLVFELKLPGFDKGAAIRRFMGHPPFSGRRPVFIADDKMDRPGFDTVLELGGIAFSVGFEMAGLTGSFAQPASVRAWLGKVTA